MLGRVNIWCPHLDYLESEPGFRKFLQSRKNAGESIWWYVCNNPREPYNNLQIDMNAMAHRTLLWQQKREGMQGLLYWDVNYWHPTLVPDPWLYFQGRILDARVYDAALSAGQIATLKPDTAGELKPVAWYDFEGGSLRDRTGNFPEGMLFGSARVENGELLLNGEAYFKVPGSLFTQVCLTSPDLETWKERPGTFIASDKRLAICPNVFAFGDWKYYICGSGVWKSRDWSGPWAENTPLRLDNLAVPKTGAFGKDRRIYAGFLPDDGWGGNEVLRELVQGTDGNLGTRFVQELIPATGAPLPVQGAVKLQSAPGKRQAVELAGVPTDFRLQVEVVPGPGSAAFGVLLRAKDDAAENGCALTFRPAGRQVQFSQSTGSSGKTSGGPAINAVPGLDKPFTVDVIVRYDILDAEIGGGRSLVTRYWNPQGQRLFFFSEGGQVEFRNIRVCPLAESYKPYPALQSH